jgi:hypothetical protein
MIPVLLRIDPPAGAGGFLFNKRTNNYTQMFIKLQFAASDGQMTTDIDAI